jgi:ABC-type antimicrobial peptide transport system permease subunit
MGRRPTMIGDYARDASWAGKDPNQEVRVVFAAVDHEFVETLGLEVVEGRTFSRDYATDDEKAFLINQETAKLIGRESAVGTPFTMFGRQGTVIGVLQNFHFQPLRREIQPLVFLLAPNYHWLGNIVVRFSPENTAATLAAIEEVWKEVLPTYPFEYVFVDEDYSQFYLREERMTRLLGNFSFLAVFIACLGLFGLASFVVEQKTKEIGIRKVLGASVSSIMLALCGEFVRLVVLSMFIAWPIAYLAARGWLDDFAYRVRLEPAVFLLTGLLALFIALLTVSFQASRAARANPVDALQYE